MEIEERDCKNCKNHDGKFCQVWDCKFEPKSNTEDERSVKAPIWVGFYFES